MTACRIVRELKNTDHALDRARAECAKFGSEWLGDERGGRYVLRTPLGTVEGTYTVEGKTIEFLVGKKPRVVPCKLIERILDQFLRDG